MKNIFVFIAFLLQPKPFNIVPTNLKTYANYSCIMVGWHSCKYICHIIISGVNVIIFQAGDFVCAFKHDFSSLSPPIHQKNRTNSFKFATNSPKNVNKVMNCNERVLCIIALAKYKIISEIFSGIKYVYFFTQ